MKKIIILGFLALLPGIATAQYGFDNLIPQEQLEAVRQRQEERDKYLQEQDKLRETREAKLLEVEAIKSRVRAVATSTASTSDDRGLNNRQEQFKKFVDERLRHSYNVTKTRITAAIERIEGFADRIEKLLDRREALGQDTAEIDEKLTELNADIDSIKTGLVDLDEAIAEIIDGADPEEDNRVEIIRAIKSEVKVLTDQIKSAHEQVVEIIRMIKALPAPDVESAQESAQ